MVETSLTGEWCLAGKLPDADVFYAALKDDGLFTAVEGATWDFKHQWPFSYSDDYFSGICRLACAFANGWGGLIVFGVDDVKRTGGHNKVVPNIDRFLAAFRQATDADLRFDFRSYGAGTDDAVDVLLVRPRLEGTSPLRFMRSAGKYPVGVIWVRNGHEVATAAPGNFPLLFCRADASEHPPVRDGSIPPSPATLKRFLGRVEVLDRLFSWLESSDEPRTYLHGKGGSGKTTVAYEFARLIKDFGERLRIEGEDTVDVVLFLSAKEKALVPATATIEQIEEPDFCDERTLLTQILYYGGWSRDREALAAADLASLRKQIQQYFDLTSALIVIDDIDTLTTKGTDPGADFIYRTLCRSQRKSKVLYTLRNAPSQSLHSAIEVPGLRGLEYEEFVEECAAQFRVKAPSAQFRGGRLAELSERRPLVIESIVALVRTAMNYERAADLFSQHAGDNVRDYVFIREWDALVGDDLPRLLLAALADLNRGATYEDLQTVLQADESRVRDAVGQVREMFLQIDEAGQEPMFSLAPLTRSFVNSRKTTLRGYHRVRERVRAFKQSVRLTSPAVAAVIAKVERLLPLRYENHHPDRLAEAWRVVADPTLPVAVTEDPKFKCTYGYACVLMQPPKLTEAREAFQYAIAMRQEPAFGELRSWFNAEKGSGAHEGRCEEIADLVIKGRSYTEVEKIGMISRKATSLYTRGRERLYTDQIDAKKDFGEALKLHLRAFRLNCLRGDTLADRSEEYARNTAHQWFDFPARGDAPWEFFEQLRELVEASDMFLDPIHRPVIDVADRLTRRAVKPDVANRMRNRLKGLPDSMAQRTHWLDNTISAHLQGVLRALDNALAEKAKRAAAPAGVIGLD